MSLNIQNKNILVIPTPVYKTHVKHCMNGAQSDLVTSHVRPIEKGARIHSNGQGDK